MSFSTWSMTSAVGDVISEDVTKCEVNSHSERNLKSLWKKSVFYKVGKYTLKNLFIFYHYQINLCITYVKLFNLRCLIISCFILTFITQ